MYVYFNVFYVCQESYKALIDSSPLDWEIGHLASEDVIDYALTIEVLILRTEKQIPNTDIFLVNSYIRLLMEC